MYIVRLCREGSYAASVAPATRTTSMGVKTASARRRRPAVPAAGGGSSQPKTIGATSGKNPAGPFVRTAATTATPAAADLMAVAAAVEARVASSISRTAVVVSSACVFSSMLLTAPQLTMEGVNQNSTANQSRGAESRRRQMAAIATACSASTSSE